VTWIWAGSLADPSDLWFWALNLGAALAAGLWFRMAVVGDPDPVYDSLNIFTFVARTIDAGIGLVIAVVASVGYVVAVAVSLVREPPPKTAPASNWPLRVTDLA